MFPNGKIKETFLSPFSVRRSTSHITSDKNIEVIFAPKQQPCFYYWLNRSPKASPKSCLQTQSSTGTILITSSGFLTQKEHLDLCSSSHPFSFPPSNTDLHQMLCFGSGLGPACSRVGKWVMLGGTGFKQQLGSDSVVCCTDRQGELLWELGRQHKVGMQMTKNTHTGLVTAPKQSVR